MEVIVSKAKRNKRGLIKATHQILCQGITAQTI